MEPTPYTSFAKPYEIRASMLGGGFKFYHVYDKNGNVIVSKETEAEANAFLGALKKKDAARATPSPSLGSVTPDANLTPDPPSTPSPPPSNAVQPGIYTAGRYGVGGRFATFDNVGAVVKMHSSLQQAEEYAETLRKADAAAGYVAAEPLGPPRSPVPKPARSPSPLSPVAIGDIPSSTDFGVASAGSSGLGSVAPKIGQLADALTRAATALDGVAAAAGVIPLATNPARPAPPPPTASMARRAIDSLAGSMTSAIGQTGDVKGLADAFKGFRDAFGRGFNAATVNPVQAPAGVMAQPGGYPRNRLDGPTPQGAPPSWFSALAGLGSNRWTWSRPKPAPAGPDTYDLGVPGSGNVQATPGGLHSFAQSIASQFRRAVSGFGQFSPSSAYQATRGFASSFGHAFGNPTGGIPFGAGGWAGSVARQAVTGIGNFASAAGSVAQRGGAGVQAAYAAYQGGGGAAGVARAFTTGAGIGGAAATAVAAFAGVTVAVVGAGVAFVDLVQRMRAFGDSVVESNRYLARYNPAIASAYVGLAVNDFRREVRFGRETQGTAITAVRAVDSMRDDWQGVDILGANVRNRFAGAFASFSGAVGADASRAASAINAQLNQADPDGLVSAGAAAGLWGGIKGAARGYYDSFMNDPAGSLLVPGLAIWRGLMGGQSAAAAAADAKVTQLAAGATDSNFWGGALHGWANQGGPLTRRPTPRR